MFILASASPRRSNLLTQIISDFKIIPSSIDEEKFLNEEIAYQKGISIANKYPEDVIISADTQVVYNNKVYGKPVDEKDAFNTLKTLLGKSHQVITYYSIICINKKIYFSDKEISTVTFKEMDDNFINEYIASKSPLDKAGSYGIQDDEKYHFIDTLIGDKANVIGLPVKALKKALESLNLLD